MHPFTFLCGFNASSHHYSTHKIKVDPQIMGNRPPMEDMYKCMTEVDSRVSSTTAESVNTNQWKLIGSGAWNDYVHVTAPYKH